ncbi:MAG: response regulator [Bacteroidia bacterium]
MNLLKILVLEDDENDFELLKVFLETNVQHKLLIEWVMNKEGFTNALKEFKPDLVISDYNLNNFTGFDALDIVKNTDPYLPIIMVTGALSEETAADCIIRGAWDYVVKGRLHRLNSAIENALKLRIEKLRLRKTQEELNIVKDNSGVQVKLLYDALARMPNAIVITDKEGTIQFVNNRFSEMTGYSAEEAVGQKNNLLKSGKHDNTFYQEMWDTLLAGKEWKGEIINKKKNGELFWEEESIASITDDNNEVVYFVSLGQDITEKKLASEELLRAKEKAEESDRLKSSFLTTMSHELRTPLNTVIGFSNLIDDSMPKEEILELSKHINKSGNDLLEIIESIFEISMLQANETKLENENVTILEIFSRIKVAAETEMRIHHKNNIQVIYSPFPHTTHLHINTDKKRILQLLSQFISNAVKFTHSGKIEYGYTVQSDGVRFFVNDTGQGIPPEKLDKIFDVFRQIDDTHTRKQGGLGLGLAICKEIAKMLGGVIEVESKENEGSKFSFYLPGKFELNSATAEEKKSSEEKELDLSSKLVLIAEDDQMNFVVLQRILKKMNPTIIWAKNGAEAVEMVNSNPIIDFILMDVKMPEMDGIEATKIIKKQHPEIPIIMQTAHSLETERNACYAAGCDGFITKPIRVPELTEVINGIVLNKA